MLGNWCNHLIAQTSACEEGGLGLGLGDEDITAMSPRILSCMHKPFFFSFSSFPALNYMQTFPFPTFGSASADIHAYVCAIWLLCFGSHACSFWRGGYRLCREGFYKLSALPAVVGGIERKYPQGEPDGGFASAEDNRR